MARASMSVVAPDKSGVRADVVLGHPDLAGYHGRQGHLLSARWSAGMATASPRASSPSTVTQYQVPVNNNGQSLHGGLVGFDSNVWDREGRSIGRRGD